MVIGLLLVALLGAIDASLWGMSGMSAELAATVGVHTAIEAQGTGSITATQTATSQADIMAVITPLVGPTMPGTHVRWAASCPPSHTAVPNATVDVCTSVPAAGYVRVELIGNLAAIVPPPFGFGQRGSGIPIDVAAEGRAGTFTA